MSTSPMVGDAGPAPGVDRRLVWSNCKNKGTSWSLRWHGNDSRDQTMQDLWATVQRVVLSYEQWKIIDDFSIFTVIVDA